MITPSPAAITGWIPVVMSTPVCSQTAPPGHDRRGVPLQYLHSLPNPRQFGAHSGSGYWKRSAELAAAAATGGWTAAGAGEAPGSIGRTSDQTAPATSRNLPANVKSACVTAD